MQRAVGKVSELTPCGTRMRKCRRFHIWQGNVCAFAFMQSSSRIWPHAKFLNKIGSVNASSPTAQSIRTYLKPTERHLTQHLHENFSQLYILNQDSRVPRSFFLVEMALQ